MGVMVSASSLSKPADLNLAFRTGLRFRQHIPNGDQMSEVMITQTNNENDSVQKTAGVPQNQQPEKGDGNAKVPTLVQRCAKAIARISKVSDVRTSKGLRKLKNEVSDCTDLAIAKIASLEAEANSGDEVDRLDCEDQITVLEKRLVDLKDGPDAVNAHAATLRAARDAPA